MGITAPKDKAERDARLDQTLAVVERHPEHWDQANTHCGTCHCFAGHAELLSVGLPPSSDCDDEETAAALSSRRQRRLGVCPNARYWLGVSFEQGADLFYWKNTLADLRRIVSEIKATPYPGAKQ